MSTPTYVHLFDHLKQVVKDWFNQQSRRNRQRSSGVMELWSIGMNEFCLIPMHYCTLLPFNFD